MPNTKSKIYELISKSKVRRTNSSRREDLLKEEIEEIKSGNLKNEDC
jgi:hypothetical protein